MKWFFLLIIYLLKSKKLIKMKSKAKTKVLSLNKETITVLNTKQQRQILGGNSQIIVTGVKVPSVKA